MDKVVHFEIPTDDLERAKGFYGKAFGWDVVTIPDMDYTTATTTPVDEQTMMPTEAGGINGGLMKRSADTPSPVITIGVDSIDRSLEQVTKSGGTVITPRTPTPDMGAFAYFKDTEGNVLGLWETARS